MSVEYEPVSAATRKWTQARRRRITLAVFGAMLVGGVSVALWMAVLRPDASAQSYHRPNPPFAPPAAYYQAVEEQIAQGLGLSVTQVKSGIRADPGEGLFGVATARDVSPDHLYTVEINAHNMASAQMVADGVWTQAQADATVQYWQRRGAKALGSDMTTWFLNA